MSGDCPSLVLLYDPAFVLVIVVDQHSHILLFVIPGVVDTEESAPTVPDGTARCAPHPIAVVHKQTHLINQTSILLVLIKISLNKTLCCFKCLMRLIRDH